MTTTNNLKNNFSSTPSPNPITENPTADPTGSATEPTSDAVDAAHDADNGNNDNNTKLTNNEDNDNTVIEEDEEEEDDDDEEEPTSPSPLLPSPPPPPPVPLSERRMTELELRRFLRRIQRPTRAHVRSRRDYVPEEDKEIMAGDDFSTFNAGGLSLVVLFFPFYCLFARSHTLPSLLFFSTVLLFHKFSSTATYHFLLLIHAHLKLHKKPYS